MYPLTLMANLFRTGCSSFTASTFGLQLALFVSPFEYLLVIPAKFALEMCTVVPRLAAIAMQFLVLITRSGLPATFPGVEARCRHASSAFGLYVLLHCPLIFIGIPNTSHFHNVTKVKDAVMLWEKIKVSKV